MRPLQLTMEAFGSYGTRTVIDFEAPNQNLFLITGDTGAGKSTIFDALVFALYGEASSETNRKNGPELQSQYAPLNTEPFVELRFREGADPEGPAYTVRRVPRHLRRLRRGTGVKMESGRVTLWMPDGSEYPAQEADGKLRSIVGLTKAQFMQVAMIAQGEFMELLRADSKDKREIFRKLFQTELYERIGQELERRKREQEQQMEQVRSAGQAAAARAAVPEAWEGQAEMKRLQERISPGKQPAVTDLEAFGEVLEQACGWLRERLSAAEKALEQAGAGRDALREALASAQSLEKLFRQLDQAEEELEACAKEERQVKEQEALAVRIRSACQVAAEYRRFQDAVQAAADIREKQKQEQKALPERTQAAQETAAREQEARVRRDRELEAFSRLSERVNRSLEILRDLETTEQAVQAGQSRWEQAEAAAQAARKRQEDWEAQERRWREQEAQWTGAEAELARWEERNREAETLGEDLTAALETQKVLAEQESRVRQAQEAYRKSRGRYESARETYERMRQGFLDAQAGVLARELRPGEPCPVCGSREHPRPFPEQPGREGCTREALERQARETEARQQDQERKAADAQETAVRQQERRERFRETFEELRRRWSQSLPEGSESLSLEEAEAAVKGRQEALGKEGVRLRQKARELEALRERLAGAGEERRKRQEAAEEARQEASQAAAAWAAQKAARDQAWASRDFPSREAAQKALEEAQKRKDAGEAAYRTARQEAKAAEEARSRTEALLLRYEKELPERQRLRDARQQEYEALRREKALEEEAWQDLASRYSFRDAEALEEQVRDYRTRRDTAVRMEAAAREAIGGQPRPVLARLEQEAAEAEAGWNRAREEREALQALYRTNRDVGEQLASLLETRRQRMAGYARLDRLCRQVTGGVTKSYQQKTGSVPGSRMDLETFVQRYYLEQILEAANRRFREMTGGQLELRMYSLEKAGEGKNHGLDLMVYSAATGKEREVRTLSGGESFLAALSLAFGMADRIQAASGAIHLDILFLDEGFGALDSQARAQAVKVLQRMAGSSRLVGIISHVAELKQEIEDQLLVTRDEKGSHARWQIS